MATVNVEVDAIVRNIAKNIGDFLQPVYEAIVNSLEANATKITVEIIKDSQMIAAGIADSKIASFVITDNGDGFTDNNRESFKKLWTTHKMNLGCKGSGRFTWLTVFNSIQITSKIASTSEVVTIPFSANYGNDDIKVAKNQVVSENITEIKFDGISESFYDRRLEADIEFVYNKILDNLLVKLFLIKKELAKTNRTFQIAIKLSGEKEKLLTSFDIPDLDSKSFHMMPEIQNSLYPQGLDFDVYYLFASDKKNSKKANYCAASRVVQKIDDYGLGFSASLPNDDSLTVLVCSKYFDDNVGDGRNSLDGLRGLRAPTMIAPILISDITARVKGIINEVISEKYPNLQAINQQTKRNAVASKPYLASYIEEIHDTLVSEDSLIKAATVKFGEAKIKSIKDFEQLIQKADINEAQFYKSLDEVSEVALAELGEYVLYRDRIIEKLNSAIVDVRKKEEYFHNLIMPMRTTASAADARKHLLSNLWLLDDKFMTYSFIASDTQINAIEAAIHPDKDKTNGYGGNNRPDLFIQFDRQDSTGEAIVVELKGVNATKAEKNKSLTELPNNIAIIREHLPSIQSMWTYIITTIDEDFRRTIENQSAYTQLFSSNSTDRAYYRFVEKSKAHVFIIDLNTVVSDALARNKTFLDILKGN